MKAHVSLLCFAETVRSFPYIANLPGISNKHLIGRQQSGGGYPGGPELCPFNANHVNAVQSTTNFPYMGAHDGVPGSGVGGYVVPDPNDPDHQFIAPTATDIRGPCPGLNVAANYGFIARDGITHFDEVVAAAQNVFNMGLDLANFLGIFGIFLADGDLVTKKVSIGCDATTRTSFSPLLTGNEPGLDAHNKFETDTSLTRDDYFLGGGDDFSFNGTLFGMMAETTGGIFDQDGMAKYRYQRYQQSRADNPQFYFGPFGLLTHGAASFLYNVLPSGKDNYVPTLENTETFFGAKQESDGSYSHVPEAIPAGWTNRKTPLSLLDVGEQILLLYGQYPVGIGGNVNGNFVGIDFPPYIHGGNLTALTASGFACLLYQLVTKEVPSSLNGVMTPTVGTLQAIVTAIGGEAFTNLGCPLPLT